MKRPIDKLRDSAGGFDLSTPDDPSHITAMIGIAQRLIIVKGRGVYEVKMADQIDPARTNIKVPNTVQRVMSVSSETPWVSTVLFTAEGFFKERNLLNGVDSQRALTLVFEIAQHLARMHEVQDEFLTSQNAALRKFNPKIRNRSVILPAVDHVEGKCKEFIQKASYVQRERLELVGLFYGEIEGAWTGLQIKVKNERPAADNFADFLDAAVPALLAIRNARNAAEHPNDKMRLEVHNFSVDGDSNLRRPAISVTHKDTPIPELSIEQFMVDVCERFVLITEMMMVYLCSRYARKQASEAGRFPIYVAELPKDRRHDGVRYSFGMFLNGEFVPMS